MVNISALFFKQTQKTYIIDLGFSMWPRELSGLECQKTHKYTGLHHFDVCCATKHQISPLLK